MIYPDSNLERSLVGSLIFNECSLCSKKIVDRSLEFASNRFQGVPLIKFQKFPSSLPYIYLMQKCTKM